MCIRDRAVPPPQGAGGWEVRGAAAHRERHYPFVVALVALAKVPLAWGAATGRRALRMQRGTPNALPAGLKAAAPGNNARNQKHEIKSWHHGIVRRAAERRTLQARHEGNS
eukprot:13303585-Alexandrium_andersonii.AAC.1